MTIDEKIKLLESRIAETDKLLAEIKKEKENTESVLAEYWNAINNKDNYYINSSNNILRCEANNSIDKDDYSNYPTKEYAEQAQKIKEFNDKLLAFKWCYDRDYKPDWNDYTSKYYIYYGNSDGRYEVYGVNSMDENSVYFSSKEIAQKCCDWLNAEMEEE